MINYPFTINMNERRLNKTNMKTQIIMIIALMAILAMAIMPAVMAEENNNETPILISANPTSEDNSADLNESVSGMKIGWSKFGLFFTFNQEKKADKELQIAKLYLIQARNAAKNNDTVGFQKAMENHNALIEKVQNRVSKLDGKTDVKGIKDKIDKLVGLERAIQVHEARIAKLNSLLLNENLTEEQIANIEDRIAKAENVTSKLYDIKDSQEDRFKTKLMAVGNMSDEEAQKVIDDFRDKKGTKKGHLGNKVRAKECAKDDSGTCLVRGA